MFILLCDLRFFSRCNKGRNQYERLSWRMMSCNTYIVFKIVKQGSCPYCKYQPLNGDHFDKLAFHRASSARRNGASCMKNCLHIIGNNPQRSKEMYGLLRFRLFLVDPHENRNSASANKIVHVSRLERCS